MQIFVELMLLAMFAGVLCYIILGISKVEKWYRDRFNRPVDNDRPVYKPRLKV